MGELIEFDARPIAAIRDRRRPGRLVFADRSIIALLRRQQAPSPVPNQPVIGPTEASVDRVGDVNFSAARAMLLGVTIGTMIWACVALGVWYFVTH